MKAATFVQETTLALKNFLQAELAQFTSAHSFEISVAVPFNDRSRSSGKSGIFGLFSSSGRHTVYLFPYLVQRAQSGRNAERISVDIVENGIRMSASKRGPETYKVRFMVTGLPMGSEPGQSLVSALVSVFFDNTSLSVEGEHGTESLRVMELAAQDDAAAVRALTSQGLSADFSPLYLLEVEVPVETGRILDRSKYVQSRSIQVSRQPNQNNQRSQNS
jgi:hypothetical protein